MTVTVVNVKDGGHIDFMCDRSTALGNPFHMRYGTDEDRDVVCEKYNDYFRRCLNPDYAPAGLLEYLDKICREAAKRDITLGCHCAPKRCHCDTIKKYIDSF